MTLYIKPDIKIQFLRTKTIQPNYSLKIQLGQTDTHPYPKWWYGQLGHTSFHGDGASPPLHNIWSVVLLCAGICILIEVMSKIARMTPHFIGVKLIRNVAGIWSIRRHGWNHPMIPGHVEQWYHCVPVAPTTECYESILDATPLFLDLSYLIRDNTTNDHFLVKVSVILCCYLHDSLIWPNVWSYSYNMLETKFPPKRHCRIEAYAPN